MRINFRNMDFWSGVMLLVTGLVAGWIALGYPMGTVLRMGSGYFPTILSGILCVFGVVLILRSVTTTEMIEPGWSFRALIILPLTFALFGYLLDRAGFIPAMAILIFGSALAGPQFKFIEVLGLAIFMTIVCSLIFIWALGLPYPLYVWPPRFGH